MGAVPGPSPDSRTRPIGVFDSGMGGLTVLHELLVRLPHEDFVYLGDTARFPYGERSAAELERFCVEIAEELISRSVKLLVVACIDVLAVVRPEAVQAVASTRSGRIGLLATPATVASGAYAEALAVVDPHVTLTAVACPDLAPIIQRGSSVDDAVVDTVREYVAPLREAEVDTVILGCTHYPLVRPLLQRMLGRGVEIVTSGAALARQVEHALSARALGSPRTSEGDYRFLCTGDAAAFAAAGTRFLQLPLGPVERVVLHAGAAA